MVIYPYKYRDFSHISAQAALAAHDQGKFWEMHRLLLQKTAQLDRASLIRYAKDLDLDMKKFTDALDGMKHAAVLERNKKLALEMDLYTTPTFFINAKKLVGDVPYARFKKVIDQELRSARK